MIRKSILKCLLMAACFTGSQSFARQNTPVETFIQQVKETNTFVKVDYLWQTDNNFDKKALLTKVEQALPLTIDYSLVANFLKQKNTAISLEFPALNGGTYTVEMAQYNYLTNDFQVHEMGANNKDIKADYMPGLYYSGVVKGIPGSVAAFSFFNNEVYGIFSIPGEGNYTLVPNTMVGRYFDYNTHYVLYNDKDLKMKDMAPKCAADQLPDLSQQAGKTTTTPNNNVYNNCSEVRVYEVGDWDMYTTKGSSTTNVTNFLTAMFNNQATLYRNEGVPIVLKYIQVNTARDNYQNITVANSGRFLDTFGRVTQNVMHGCDVAILVSTALNGGYGAMGGVAWLRCMCASYNSTNRYGPYGFMNIDDNTTVPSFPTYSWDVEGMTHEMGHMVGSPHTHKCCWNPPARNTAIDGCYTIEGTCADPGDPTPTVGGTIMSYCHLTSSGINFTNGFGPQPGDTIRRFISTTFGSSSSCGARYNPNIANSKVNRTITANRECTDLVSGVSTTYYWKDNNTADHADDTLVLMVIKNGNNIGNLNTTGFSVTASTIANYGGGLSDTVTFPTGTVGVSGNGYTMRRYWKINATTDPTSAVEVIFPFLQADTSDVNGSVPGPAPLGSYRMYKVNSPIDPNPANNFPGAVAGNFSIYTYGTAPSTSVWSLTTSGTTYLAHMKMTNLSGGGTGFYNSGTLGADKNIFSANTSVHIFPNPTDNQWHVSVAENTTETLTFQLYTVEGKLLQTKVLENGAINTIDAAGIASGIYFYRVIGGEKVVTGSLQKN